MPRKGLSVPPIDVYKVKILIKNVKLDIRLKTVIK